MSLISFSDLKNVLLPQYYSQEVKKISKQTLEAIQSRVTSLFQKARENPKYILGGAAFIGLAAYCYCPKLKEVSSDFASKTWDTFSDLSISALSATGNLAWNGTTATASFLFKGTLNLTAAALGLTWKGATAVTSFAFRSAFDLTAAGVGLAWKGAFSATSYIFNSAVNSTISSVNSVWETASSPVNNIFKPAVNGAAHVGNTIWEMIMNLSNPSSMEAIQTKNSTEVVIR